MAKTLLIMGESGSGKTTSMRNLDPATTYYIDADKKGLSWKGWKKQYNTEAKNYYSTSDGNKIKSLLKGINDNAPHIKTVIVDTVNAIMIDDEFSRMNEKNYDKWMDMAYCVYDLIDACFKFRDDLTIIFTMHSQTERDDSGFSFTRAKTSGKKLDKIVLESKFTTVLLSKCLNGKYVFETHANNSTAKSPMGAFDTDTIDNDIVAVIKSLEEF